MKAKSIISILLTIVIVFFGASLPYLAGHIYDSINTGHENQADIRSLQLEINELTLYEKMLLSIVGTTIQVSDEQAYTQREDLPEVIAAAIVPYLQTGYFYFEADLEKYINSGEIETNAYPLLSYMPSDPGKSNVFWIVDLFLDDYYSEYIHMVIDDETGTLVALIIRSDAPILEGYDCQEVAHVFYYTYCNIIGIENPEEYIYHTALADETNYDVANFTIDAAFPTEGTIFEDILDNEDHKVYCTIHVDPYSINLPW